MKLELEIYSCLCATEKFTINALPADTEEFGSQYDRDSSNADDYGCGNMQFTGKESTEAVLLKYGISEEDYREVVRMLEDKLSFGCCGWCA